MEESASILTSASLKIVMKKLQNVKVVFSESHVPIMFSAITGWLADPLDSGLITPNVFLSLMSAHHVKVISIVKLGISAGNLKRMILVFVWRSILHLIKLNLCGIMLIILKLIKRAFSNTADTVSQDQHTVILKTKTQQNVSQSIITNSPIPKISQKTSTHNSNVSQMVKPNACTKTVKTPIYHLNVNVVYSKTKGIARFQSKKKSNYTSVGSKECGWEIIVILSIELFLKRRRIVELL